MNAPPDKQKWSRGFRLIAFFLLLFLFWIGLAPLLARVLIVEKPLARADAILVLGGSYTYVERTQKAAELYKQGIAPRVLLTDDGEFAGWSRREGRNPPFVELARRALVAQGVPDEAIETLAPPVTGTIYEARLLSEKSRAAGYDAVLLVTSAYHTRRALSTFERVLGADGRPVALGVAAPPPGRQTPPVFTWWLSRHGWNFVAGEYVKFIVYWLYY